MRILFYKTDYAGRVKIFKMEDTTVSQVQNMYAQMAAPSWEGGHRFV